MPSALRRLARALVLSAACASAAAAQAPQFDADAVLATWRLLDYVAVDYREAVKDGAVVNADEYAEMREFSATIERKIGALPAGASADALKQQAAELRQAIDAKGGVADVARRATSLAEALVAAFPVPIAPQAAPDLSPAPRLYADQCASCHGATGRGDGPLGASLDPPPVDFHDAARSEQRSVFALYGVITHGVEETGMRGYAELPEAQRWALAFHVGQLAYTEADRQRGAELWKDLAAARQAVPGLQALVDVTPARLATALGPDHARAVTAFLRANPQALGAGSGDPLAAARASIAQSAQRYAAGDVEAARDLALSAYLDGFEPVEAALAGKDRPLMHEVEAAMLDYRARIEQAADAQAVAAQAAKIDALLARAGAVLRAPAVSSAALGAGFIILFREGLEAILVLMAMVSFLRKTDHPTAMRYVHGGWVAALLLGFATWAVATWVIAITGAQREATEGVTGFIAVVVLVVVGLWMHSQSASGRWQQYIREKIAAHLSQNQLWGLALLSFVAVYREVFETVLFYRALWEQGAHGSIVLGAALAVVALAAVGWALFRAGARLPIRAYFLASSALIMVLAVVLAGRAAAALQEAGWLGVTLWPAPTLDWLGIYPTMQTLVTQLIVLAVVVAGIVVNGRRKPVAA